MEFIKTITIDQLKPGMFIVGMDQPWFRTPFLVHRRLIRHTNEIDLLRRHGVKEVKIDASQGLDVEPVPSGNMPPSSHVQGTAAAPQPSHSVEPASPEGVPQPASSGETKPAQPLPNVMQQNAPTTLRAQESVVVPQPSRAVQPVSPEAALQPASSGETKTAQPLPHITQNSRPTPSKARELAAAARETYREASCSMERMFEELEAGVAPRPDTVRMVVTNVVSRVLDDGSSMLSLHALQKMKRFDRTLASHALDICTLSLIVAHAYGVAGKELEALGAGALLHDIGYIRLPRNLYRRSHDLTEQEGTMMQQHPALGLAILQEAHEDRDEVIRIVVEHHECSDGNGFPHKLKGGSLSVLSQLVGLVDIYDGMVSRRGGRPAMLPHDAIRQLFRLGDTGQYPKELIQSLIGSLGVYPIGSLVLMNTGEQAVVVGMNPTQRLKPIVKVITGPQGGSYLTPIRVDLGNQTAGASARVITKALDPLHERVNVAMFLDGILEEAA
jgi:putative nucleotidyltransferase with HDIG domain